MAEDTEVPIDVIEETIANGYSWAQAASDVAGNPFIFDDPVLGFRDFDEVTDITDPGDATYTTVAGEGDIPIMQSEVIDALPTDMDPEAQSILAMKCSLTWTALTETSTTFLKRTVRSIKNGLFMLLTPR